jgi:tetrahydrodipicolinate N-succinyltransferase
MLIGTMADTWATVGSCAQIGKDVHLSGEGIWVLEPAQASTSTIEMFIGSHTLYNVEGAFYKQRVLRRCYNYR